MKTTILKYSVAPPRRGVKLSLYVFVSLWAVSMHAQQNTDDLYRKPLKEVLGDIQKRYGVQI